MKKLILILILLLTVTVPAFARDGRVSNPTPSLSGDNTFTGANTFTGSVGMNTMKATDARSNVSAFVLSGDHVFTAAELDGRVYVIPSGTAAKLKFPTAANGLGCYLIDLTATVGAAAGMTPWCTGSSMYAGSGTGAVAGTSIFPDSGVTGSTTRVVAMPMNNGSWGWRAFSDISTWHKVD